MPSPSKFILDSDLASTPAPMTGAITITLTSPASQYIQDQQVIEIKSEIALDAEFDTLNYIITCDQEPDVIGYNTNIIIGSGGGLFLEAGVAPVGNKIQLYGLYYSTVGSYTFTGSYTFRAVVIPIKSPFS